MGKKLRQAPTLKREGGLFPEPLAKSPRVSNCGNIDLARHGARKRKAGPPHPPYPDGPPGQAELNARRAERELFGQLLRAARAELVKKYGNPRGCLPTHLEKVALKIAANRMDVLKGRRGPDGKPLQAKRKGSRPLLRRVRSMPPGELEEYKKTVVVLKEEQKEEQKVS